MLAVVDKMVNRLQRQRKREEDGSYPALISDSCVPTAKVHYIFKLGRHDTTHILTSDSLVQHFHFCSTVWISETVRASKSEYTSLRRHHLTRLILLAILGSTSRARQPRTSPSRVYIPNAQPSNEDSAMHFACL